jgi:hypothetical protein
MQMQLAASFNGSTTVVASPAYAIFGTENKMEIMGDKTTAGANYQYNGHIAASPTGPQDCLTQLSKPSPSRSPHYHARHTDNN